MDVTLKVESQAFEATSSKEPHPSESIKLPKDPWAWTMTGGGGEDHWTGWGNMLTATCPAFRFNGEPSPQNIEFMDNTWFSAGKDHAHSDPANLTVAVVGVRLGVEINGQAQPIPIQAKIFASLSPEAQHPSTQILVPEGEDWVITGGGAFDINDGVPWGNLLTGSWPAVDGNGRITGWNASGKDHAHAGPSRVASFVIAVRLVGDAKKKGTLTSALHEVTSTKAAHPSIEIRPTLGENEVIVGGGAKDNWQGFGNMLTASTPISESGKIVGWKASGKDHMESDPATITAYAIVLKAGLKTR